MNKVWLTTPVILSSIMAGANSALAQTPDVLEQIEQYQREEKPTLSTK